MNNRERIVRVKFHRSCPNGETEYYTIEYLDETTLELSFDYGDGDISYSTYERVE